MNDIETIRQKLIEDIEKRYLNPEQKKLIKIINKRFGVKE